VIRVTSYVDDYSPGAGRRTPARSRLDSDAAELSLNGDWDFRLLPADTFETMPVPSHWVLDADGRFGSPIYTNVQYPFPVDPPHVPDENPTAEYRREFELTDWDAPRTLLRFDGVESVYRVWLNGSEVGVGKGSRLAQEFDVSEFVRPGRNEITVLVHQWSSMSYLEDQDQWWLPGIFRDVTLLARPDGGIDDLWLRCGYDAGRGRVDAEIVAEESAFPVTIEIFELGVRRTFATAADVEPIEIDEVEPWSAETPRLYPATVTSRGERIRLRLGFRSVAVVGDVFTVNGSQVIFRGMNRHETHPERGRVFDETHARADLALMKRHNVNAIRFSHYPPHPRVLDLADELGFWVIDECDLETHGFVFSDWADNPSDDLRWRDAYLDRIERTVERDKNHPCVVIWSLGNESGTGVNLAAMSHWVHGRDPERPVHYEGDYVGAYTDVYSRMYPNLVETAAIGGETGPLLQCGPGDARRVRSKPFLMCEYAHAMGNGPGALQDYDDLTARFRRLHGGFVWEWRDHGLLARTADGTPYFAYGGDFGEIVHDGNFVMDGMVLPDDTPTPGLAEFAAVHAPVLLDLDEYELTVVNRQHTASTGRFSFRVTREVAGRPGLEIELEVPELAPGATASVPLPSELLTADPEDETWLTVRAGLAAAQPWAPAGHVVALRQLRLSRSAPKGSTPGGSRTATAPQPVPAGPWTTAEVEWGPAVFDARTGGLRRLHGLELAGPRLELWRGPTDNDRSGTRGSFELAAPEDSGGEGVPGPSSELRWRARGLDRLVPRVVEVAPGPDGLTVRHRVGAAASHLFVDVTYHWRLGPAGLELSTQISPSTDWDCTWPRIGLRFDLPLELDRASWFGRGPLESYPDSVAAAHVGRFTAGIAELNVDYSRPQETGHRADLRSLVLSSGDVARLRLDTRPGPGEARPGFTFTHWTPQQLDRAAHPYELGEPTRSHLFLDAAVHGLGSRACGIDVLPQHALWPSAREFTVTFGDPSAT
jgi:beta-galactosidase